LPGQGGPPGAPTNLAAAPDGSSAVTLSWDPPASDGGAGIIYYDVLEGTSLLREVPASDTSDTVAVASGTVYTFQVSATNDYEQQGPAATVTYPASSHTIPASPQTITFGPLASQPVNARFTVSAAATSGLAVTFTSGTPAVCAVSDSAAFDQADVMTVTAGTCTIVAAQGGNADWAAAASIQQSFRVIPSPPPLTPQTITFGPLASQPVNARFTVSAAATSGLAVTFSSGTPAVCAVSGATVTTVAAGTCTIVAAQGGNADYALASDVTQSFRVGSGTPAGSLPLLIAVAAAVIVVAAAATLAVRRRRLRSRPSPAADLGVRAVPHAGPPVTVRVHATGTGATHTVRIEPHPGASVTTIEESQP
jgi:Fibronectin type III domain